jgi:hypothetical protein
LHQHWTDDNSRHLQLQKKTLGHFCTNTRRAAPERGKSRATSFFDEHVQWGGIRLLLTTRIWTLGPVVEGLLKRNSAGLDRSLWPFGEMTRDQMIEQVTTMKVAGHFRDCAVASYLGEYSLISHRRSEALPYLQQAAVICSGEGEFERDAALGEVKRMQNAQ